MKISKQRQIKETNQIDFVLSLLKRKGSVTTLDLKDLGIGAPAAIIKKLRDAGYRIDTDRVNVKNSNSLIHKNMANYIFISDATSSWGGK
jgi:hypothetical protein